MKRPDTTSERAETTIRGLSTSYSFPLPTDSRQEAGNALLASGSDYFVTADGLRRADNARQPSAIRVNGCRLLSLGTRLRRPAISQRVRGVRLRASRASHRPAWRSLRQIGVCRRASGDRLLGPCRSHGPSGDSRRGSAGRRRAAALSRRPGAVSLGAPSRSVLALARRQRVSGRSQRASGRSQRSYMYISTH